MKAIETWSLRRTTDDGEGARSHVFRDGTATGRIVPGCVLEAQFSVPGGALLFTTHDIPFEECLDILLLTEAGTVADRASLFGSLTTGHFRDVRVTGPDSVTFNFFGHHRWRVRLLSRPSFRLPIAGWEQTGVHRRFGWTRRFAVEKVP